MEMISHNTMLTPRRDEAAIKNLPLARTFSAALALTALVTASTPALATTRHHHHHHVAARSLNGLNMYAGESLGQSDPVLGAMPMSEGRAQAMHDCNMKAQPYSFSTWQTMQFSVYNTCMTEHGQTP
jgi:hypothetical protein